MQHHQSVNNGILSGSCRYIFSPRYDYYDMHTRRVFEHQEKYHIFFSVLTGTFHSDIKCVGARSIKL